MGSGVIAIYLAMAFVLFAAGCLGNTPDASTSKDVPGQPADVPSASEQRLESRTPDLLIGGSGTNLPIMEKLAEAYMGENPGVYIKIMPSIGSGGGVKSTASGDIGMGVISRGIKSSEEKYNLTYRLMAKDAVVFAVHPSVLGVDGLSAQQILDIYSGKIINWKDAGGNDLKIIVLGREEGDSGRSILEKKLPGFNETAHAAGITVLNNDPSMHDTLEATTGSIGYISFGAIKASGLKVKSLKLDGAAGSDSGYPYMRDLGIVLNPEPSGVAKSFMGFIFSAKGKQIMADSQYIPVQ